MPLPQPEDVMDRIRKLEQEVRDLRASVTNRGGLTTASAGWHIPSGTLPSTPSSGGHLTALGTEPYWTDSTGSSYSLVPPEAFTGTSTPQYPTSFDSPASIIGAPTQDDYNLLRSDCAMLQVCIRSIIVQGADTTPALWPSPV